MNNDYRAKKAYQNIKIAKYYDKERFYKITGKLFDYLEKDKIRKSLNHLKINKDILDLPCGTGRIKDDLERNGFKVVGGDISIEMLNEAKLKINKYTTDFPKLIRVDAENLSFKDNTFDCVISIRLMGHVSPDIRKNILLEMKRVSNGNIIAEFYNKNIITRMKRYYKLLISKSINSNKFWFPVTKKELFEEIDNIGMEIKNIYPIFKYFSETWVILLISKK